MNIHLNSEMNSKLIMSMTLCEFALYEHTST